MKRQRWYSQFKEQNPEKTNETEINLPDKEFKALVIRMLTELGKRIDEHSEQGTRKYKKDPIRNEVFNS